MTREEAIRRMECCRNFLTNNYSDMGEPNVTAFNMAIKALEQEPCEDCISRQAINGYIDYILSHGMGKKKSFDFIKKFVANLPSVTSIRPKGHWEDDCGDLKCPYCETRVSDLKVFSPLTKYTNTCWFCPICGADMKEGEE